MIKRSWDAADRVTHEASFRADPHKVAGEVQLVATGDLLDHVQFFSVLCQAGAFDR